MFCFVFCAEMDDQWGDYKHRDKVNDGVIFHVKYLGSILVSELTEEGQSYGDGIGAEAIKTIVAMVCNNYDNVAELYILLIQIKNFQVLLLCSLLLYIY